MDFTPPPFKQSGLKLVCTVNIVYGNLKSENSQDKSQKPQPNCTFMNSASESIHYGRLPPAISSQIHSPWLGDKVTSGIGLSYWQARLRGWRAGTTTQSGVDFIPPVRDLWIRLQDWRIKLRLKVGQAWDIRRQVFYITQACIGSWLKKWTRN
jgi:hypothetical protein